MSQFTTAWYHQLMASKRTKLDPAPVGVPVKRETGKGGLNSQILAYCEKQNPPLVPLYARTDVPSTLPLGCHDMTIFCKYPKVILTENKAGNKKPDEAQRIWIARLQWLGWTVHIIHSMEEFLTAVNS